MDLFSAGILNSKKENKSVDFKLIPWMESPEIKMVLVTNETLKACIDHCLASESGFYSLDLETTGLDTRVFNGETVSKIVGVCLSPDGNTGYYIPLRHAPNGTLSEENVSPSLFRKEFTRLIDSPLKAIFHNGKFDQEFLSYNGGEPYGLWNNPNEWEDTLVLAYLRNSRQRGRGLKALSKLDLNMEMFSLKYIFELNGLDLGNKTEAGFAELSPTGVGVVPYAASDAICTYRLFFKIKDEALILSSYYEGGGRHTQKLVYAIEKSCIAATRWMERCGLHIDVNKVRELTQLGQREYLVSLNEIYEESSKILRRDIQPLSHYLWIDRIAELNPELDTYPEEDERNFKQMRKWARNEAKKLVKDFKNKSLFYTFTMEEKYKLLLQREAPPTEDIEYDITSQKQLGQLLFAMNIPGLERTETGQVKTNKEAMNKIFERNEDSLVSIKYIKKFREIEKALGTYLEHMYDDSCKMMLCQDCMFSFQAGGHCPKCLSKEVSPDHRIKVKFNGLNVETGRFSVKQGKGPDKDGGARVPLHGLPSGYDPSRPECMTRLRECFTPLHKGWYFAPIDYAGVELRIVTNLSREPLWEKEYFRCSDCDHTFPRKEENGEAFRPPPFCPSCKSDKIGDLHTLTAMAIYGSNARDQKDWKQLRQNGKGTNFSLSYGGGPRAVVAATGCHETEAYRIKDQFDKFYKTLALWWAMTVKFAQTHGYVRTVMGRKYPLPNINDDDKKLRSKAERNAVNSPVQGSSADITKLAMSIIYLDAIKKGWVNPMDPSKDKIRMVLTMHDELGFEIAPDILEEALIRLDHLMSNNGKIRKLNWNIPLMVDVELGTSWAAQWNFSAMKNGIKPVPEELKGLISIKEVEEIEDEDKEELDLKEYKTELRLNSENLNYRMQIPLDFEIAKRVGYVIARTVKSKEEGGKFLYLTLDTGESIPWPGGGVAVDPELFITEIKKIV